MNQLNKYLNINAAFSLISGLFMIIFNEQLLSLFTLSDESLFPVLGANLLFFAAFVCYVSRWKSDNKTLVYLISILDALWVIGSFLILLLTPIGISSPGNIAIGVVAIWIGYLGYMQFRNVPA